MGDYGTRFERVKKLVVGKNAKAAHQELKELLLLLNTDYKNARSPKEIETLKRTIERLLPVLNDLKAGQLTHNSAVLLGVSDDALKPVASAPPPPQKSPISSAAATTDGGEKKIPSHPYALENYKGSEKVKERLKISIGAARKSGKLLAHTLICSSYGSDQTMLAKSIAYEMKLSFVFAKVADLSNANSLAVFFSNIEVPSLIFINEIQALTPELQARIFSFITDRKVSFVYNNNTVTRTLPAFTLVGVTTQQSKISEPLLDCFGNVIEFDAADELKMLILERLKNSKYKATDGAVSDILRRCRGDLDILEAFTKGIIDIAIGKGEKLITEKTAAEYFEACGIDPLGLTRKEIDILKALYEVDSMSISDLESQTGIPRKEIEEYCEPYLLKLGFIEIDSRGRLITAAGFDYIHPDVGITVKFGDGANGAGEVDGIDEADDTASNNVSEDEAADIDEANIDSDTVSDGTVGDTVDDTVDDVEASEPAFYDEGDQIPNPTIPLTFDEFIGQKSAKNRLMIMIEEHKRKNTPFPNTLLRASCGEGKETLARIVASQMEIPFIGVNAADLKDANAISKLFSKIEDPCLVFINDIHLLKESALIGLDQIIAEHRVSYVDDCGKYITAKIPNFVLMGATAHFGQKIKLSNDFEAVIDFADYSEEEVKMLINIKLKKLGYEVTEGAVADISCRSRRTPKIIETFLRGIIELAIVNEEKIITEKTSAAYFNMCEIDDLGLGKNDLRILEALAAANRSMFLTALESQTGIRSEEIELRYEPYLLKLGFIEKNTYGRMISRRGLDYIRFKHGDN